MNLNRRELLKLAGCAGLVPFIPAVKAKPPFAIPIPPTPVYMKGFSIPEFGTIISQYDRTSSDFKTST